METTTVLIVDRDPVARELVGGWLEAAGYEVLGCPGPDDGYHCVGTRRGTCALAHGADVVLLDLTSTSGATAALRAFYESTGTAVAGTIAPHDRATLVAAVGDALEGSGGD